ncbi:sulfatase [Vibrio sp. SS-MA-C1-2]|uniref:sulfatase n=1 Tax=Vibrio sp. SS-MA-C1-2 TaxID=2908646 RepID=UPI001F4610DF|nr:sulfatase [Vibrio sp. SS-MA-C1-2]UJF18251.1 sulfatase [Vibrio sp. SS-MA-C1-2]
MTTITQPNILFILIDDMGYKDLGCFGSDFYETPYLDALAKKSIRFTNGYAASPVCSPTRAAFLTGKHPTRLGITQWLGGTSQGRLCDVPTVDHLATSHTSLAQALKDGGYKTWHVGKWHLSTHDKHRFKYYPDKHGFDLNIGGCDWGHPKQGYFSPYGIETLQDGPKGEYLTDRLTDEAINLIQTVNDQPWFMQLSHYAVHTPIQCHQALITKYQKKAKRLGRNEGNAFVVGDHFPCQHKQDERIVRRVMQSDPTYAAMIENLDWNIGRTLEALELNGQRDNTIVIFYSDNGGLATAEGSPTSNAPLAEGKGWLADGGIREPLIISWPEKIKQPRIETSLLTTMDFFPTLLQCAGLPPMPSAHLDGISFAGLLSDSPDENFERGPLFWQYPHYSNQGGTPSIALREHDWKLVFFYEDNATMLFNLTDDISEANNIAKFHPERVNKMLDKIKAWEQDMSAQIPQPNKHYIDIRTNY